MTQHSTIGQITDQLRAAIDRGHTGDKVPAFDPAAAPLGTDEEAAGTPIPKEAIALAHAQETANTARMPAGQAAGTPPRRRNLLFIIGGAVVVIALLLALTA